MARPDLESIYAAIARHEADNAERARKAADKRARRTRRRSREQIEASRKAAMAKVTRETYQSAHPPLPGSPRDVRLRILGMSSRELARRAGLHHTTVLKAERAFEAGNPDAVGGPSLRKLADGIERATGRRTRIDDVRAPRESDHG